jgi:D-arabinose 5-phosphate isomerase GutQ
MSEGLGTSSPADNEGLLAVGRSRIFEEAQALRLVGESLDESFVAAVRLIRSSEGKVVTVGVGTSGPVARRMAHLLSTTGGGSAELNEFMRLARTRGAALLVLTAKEESPLARAADVAVVLPQTPDSDPGGIIAMGSNLAVAAWGDALAIVLMQISGYSWEQVIDAHPSGAVGQREQLPAALPRLPDPAARGSDR